MYKLPYFQELNHSKVLAFIKENSFAVITGNGDLYPVITQIPLEVITIKEKVFLEGHLMKNTDHHKAFLKNPNVTALFTGPHCYVSASWYNDVQTASTWNYISVHAKGRITFTDEAGTCQAIEAVTNKFEGENSPASFKNIPAAYIDKLVNAIVGFTIEVETIDNVFKLSQNKTVQEQNTIIEKLKETGDYNSLMIAGEMKERLV